MFSKAYAKFAGAPLKVHKITNPWRSPTGKFSTGALNQSSARITSGFTGHLIHEVVKVSYCHRLKDSLHGGTLEWSLHPLSVWVRVQQVNRSGIHWLWNPLRRALGLNTLVLRAGCWIVLRFSPVGLKCELFSPLTGTLPALKTREEGSISQPSKIIIHLRKQVNDPIQNL